jgi:TIR domain
MINPGEEWERKIDDHLTTARIILLLVSADFLASHYCYDVEVQRAVERHEAGNARVIPIILKPCDWEGTPFGKLQALPKDGKPVTTWKNREQAFTDIVSGIKAAVAHIPRTSLQEAVGQIPSRPQSGLTRQPKRVPLTVAITDSATLSSARALRRIQNIISPYLDSHTIWYCGSFGIADEIAAEYLLQENQQVIVVGNALRISDHMRFLLETYQPPFVDAQQEQLPNMPGNTSKRDILFFTKSDLVILIWDGQSRHTRFFLNWLREQHKDHLVVFV